MARFISPVPQYLDAAGDPLALGKLYFFISGTNDPLETFADVNETISNTHPVELTGDGRVPNIFFSGAAKVVLTDSDDVQFWEKDPVTAGGDEGTIGEDWNAISIYQINSVVDFEGELYISITNNNQNNNPSTTPEAWTRFDLLKRWNINETYGLGDPVIASDGFLYTSTISVNLGDDPTAKSGDWTLPLASASGYTPSAPITATDVQGALDEVAETMSGRNLIINGGFDLWQRGTAFASGPNEYAADRWFKFADALSNQSQDVPDGVTSGFSAFYSPDPGANLTTRTTIELNAIGNMKPFTPNTFYTLSFWVKLGAPADTNVRIFYSDNIFLTNNVLISTGNTFTIGNTAWNRIEVTFGTGSIVPVGTNECIVIEFGVVDIDVTAKWAEVKLEVGTVDTPFTTQGATIGEELALCQRYFQKSYNITTDPGAITAAGTIGVTFRAGGVSYFPFMFPVRMRVAAVITLYSPTTGNAGEIVNDTGATSPTASASAPSQIGMVGLQSISPSPASEDIGRFHWTADAEL